MRGVENTRREFRFVKSSRDQGKTSLPITQVEMQNARLPRHQSSYVAIGCDPNELIKRRLRGSMIGNREFTKPDNRVDEHEIFSHASREGDRREFVAPRPTEGR
jgi:hypothetical protein